LNAFGGQKFFDSLVGKLLENRRSSTELAMSGLHLQQKEIAEHEDKTQPRGPM
jgi:hypothetical protein